MEAIKFFLSCVDVFFVLYLIGYSTFLLLSVMAGSVFSIRSAGTTS